MAFENKKTMQCDTRNTYTVVGIFSTASGVDDFTYGGNGASVSEVADGRWEVSMDSNSVNLIDVQAQAVVPYGESTPYYCTVSGLNSQTACVDMFNSANSRVSPPNHLVSVHLTLTKNRDE